jgi:hypothetical protein
MMGCPTQAWLIVWEYDDRSSHGVLRAYLSEYRAKEDLALLGDADPHGAGMRKFSLVKVELKP